jgi:hypothetical protein
MIEPGDGYDGLRLWSQMHQRWRQENGPRWDPIWKKSKAIRPGSSDRTLASKHEAWVQTPVLPKREKEEATSASLGEIKTCPENLTNLWNKAVTSDHQPMTSFICVHNWNSNIWENTLFFPDRFSLVWPRLAWNSRSSCLCFPGLDYGMHHHTWLLMAFWVSFSVGCLLKSFAPKFLQITCIALKIVPHPLWNQLSKTGNKKNPPMRTDGKDSIFWKWQGASQEDLITVQ